VKNINKKQFGSIGEKIALQHLIENDYNIVETNYRIGKIGEIDIIARKDEFLCFIEVKTRSSDLFGTPSEAVVRHKQMTIRKLAQIYITSKKLSNVYLRFDIVEIRAKKSDSIIFKLENINVIENAF